MQLIEKYGAPGGTRTPDLLVRSQTLYPTELRAHSETLHFKQFTKVFQDFNVDLLRRRNYGSKN